MGEEEEEEEVKPQISQMTQIFYMLSAGNALPKGFTVQLRRPEP
jgi:hypothetical protein